MYRKDFHVSSWIVSMELSAHLKLLLAKIETLSSGCGFCFAKPKNIYDALCLSKSSYYRQLADLIEIGAVEKFKAEGHKHHCLRIKEEYKLAQYERHQQGFDSPTCRDSTVPPMGLSQSHLRDSEISTPIVLKSNNNKNKSNARNVGLSLDAGESKRSITQRPTQNFKCGGEGGFVELSEEQYFRLRKKYGIFLKDGIKKLDRWIASKPKQLDWFYAKYASAFSYLNNQDSWIWEGIDKMDLLHHPSLPPRNPKSAADEDLGSPLGSSAQEEENAAHELK